MDRLVMEVEVPDGMHIERAAQKVCVLADVLGTSVRFKFNGITITVDPEVAPERVVAFTVNEVQTIDRRVHVGKLL